MRDFVNDGWARTVVKKVDRAIAEFNAQNPGKAQMMIVWGYPDRETADFESEVPARYQVQEALLNFCDVDFGVECRRHGDSDHPDYMVIKAEFATSHSLPLTARELFNTLQDCEEGIRLTIFPDDGEIACTGVQAYVPLERLSSRVLHDALWRVRFSCHIVEARLNGDEADDHWGWFRGE